MGMASSSHSEFTCQLSSSDCRPDRSARRDLSGPEKARTSSIEQQFLIGDVTFDRSHGLLYVLELFADQAKPVVHVWRIQ